MTQSADAFLADLQPGEKGVYYRTDPGKVYTAPGAHLGETRGSPVDRLSAQLETVWDEWRKAADAEAEAANAFERVHALCFREAEFQDDPKIPATILVKHVDARPQVVEANGVLLVARTNERTWRKKWDTVNAQLMSALSNQRMVREQT